MPRKQTPQPARKKRNEDETSFEEFVTAALKVDPKGLSGKHRKEQTDEDEQEGS